MSTLRISLFGGVRVEHECLPKAEKVTRTMAALLASLLLHSQRSHSREVLCGLFWGDHADESAGKDMQESGAGSRLKRWLTGRQGGMTRTTQVSSREARRRWLG